MKTFVVTGATSGIGESLVKSFIGEDVRVIALGKSEEKLDKLKNNLINKVQIKTFLINLENVSSIKSAIEPIFNEHIDGFIHCAGFSKYAHLRKINYSDFVQIMNVNFFSFVEILKLLVANKEKQSNFRAVAISSISSFRGIDIESMYAASKGALDSFIKSISQDLLSNNVQINSIQPVFVDTPMINTIRSVHGAEFDSYVRNFQPLGLIPTEDIVEQIKFLLYRKSEKVTGTSIYMNAGKI